MSYLAVCAGEVFNLNGSPQCSAGWEFVSYSIPFDPSQLEPAMLGAMFAAGFSSLSICMIVTFAARQLYLAVKTL